jgi:hypothetical protein
MIYTFSNSIFENLNDDSLDSLDKIWSNSKGRNFLFIQTKNNFDTIRSSQWFRSLRKSSQDHIDQQFTASAQLGKSDKILTVSNENDMFFSLEEAFELLTKPVTVILEHIEYDAYFLDAIIRTHEQGLLIKEYYDNGWLIYINGNGNNIVNVINAMKDRFEKNKVKFPKNSSTYIKALVIIDSDKKYLSTNEVAEDKISLLNFIKINTPYHVLLKREMENYLPEDIYNDISQNVDFKNAYKTLNPSQKDYFDLENGLPDKNFNQLDADIQSFYSDISDAYKKVFRKGKLTFYKEDGRKDSFKARFPKLFLSPNITKDNLEGRAESTNKNELKEILQKILDLL